MKKQMFTKNQSSIILSSWKSVSLLTLMLIVSTAWAQEKANLARNVTPAQSGENIRLPLAIIKSHVFESKVPAEVVSILEQVPGLTILDCKAVLQRGISSSAALRQIRQKNSFQQNEIGKLSSQTLLDSTIYWIWSILTDSLMPVGKTIYDYDAGEKIKIKKNQKWDENTNDWENESQWLYAYNTVDSLITFIGQEWNGTGWTNNWKDSFTYNVSNTLISEINQSWDGTGWTNDQREIYTYDTLGNQDTVIYQIGNGSNWMNDWREISKYDVVGNQIYLVEQYWDENINDWLNDYQGFATYDANNNRDTLLIQGWNETINAWVNAERSISTYNAANNQTNGLRQWWDGNNWVNEWQAIYDYNVSNNLINYLEQEWDGNNWTDINQESYTYYPGNHLESILRLQNGIPFSKALYAYDANNNIASILSQVMNGSNWVDDRESRYTYDNENNKTSEASRLISGGSWLTSDSTHYYYRSITSVNDYISRPSTQAAVFPNPFSDFTTIVINNLQKPAEPGTIRLELFDALGRRTEAASFHSFQSSPNSAEIKLERGCLPAGIYYYRVIINRETLGSGKMVAR